MGVVASSETLCRLFVPGTGGLLLRRYVAWGSGEVARLAPNLLKYTTLQQQIRETNRELVDLFRDPLG